MILVCAIFIILMVCVYAYLSPTNFREWFYLTCSSALLSVAFVLCLSLFVWGVCHPAETQVSSKNIALTNIAGDYFAVGHVDKDGSLYFTMIEADNYSEISCSNQHFSRTNAMKSDSYLEIKKMNYANSVLRLLFFNMCDDQYLLHAPQNAVFLDVPY